MNKITSGRLRRIRIVERKQPSSSSLASIFKRTTGVAQPRRYIKKVAMSSLFGESNWFAILALQLGRVT